ncbi:integrase [Streptomyces sp. NPDC020983]|uniref:integrase n=1 Tax=Streptomyces sp. NPDC020983 TaxID=3365106 RepID=UPI0037A3514B
MPYIEARGGSIRVRWWNGAYKLDADGRPTSTKLYDSASGPERGTKFKDEQEAWNYGLDREHEVRHGKYIPKIDGKVLMRDYCRKWIEALDLRHNSVRNYRSRINVWIVTYWGNHAVAEINSWEYEAWRRSLRAKVARGEMGDVHCSQVLGLFSMLMDDAVKFKLRSESPVLPQRRRGRYAKKNREKKRPFQMETLHALATNAHAVWGYTGWVWIWTIAFTGMRPPGEMAGLRREYASPTWPSSDPETDPDLRAEAAERYGTMPALRVQWQVQYDGNKRQLVEPKYQSMRTLVVPPFLHEMHSVLAASHASPWVFPGLRGGEVGNHFNKTYWAPIRDGAPARTSQYARAEILPVEAMAGKRQYLIRHWHKEMLSEDKHPRVAQEARMGHEVAGVEGLYDNVTPKMEQDIADALQARWDAFMGPEHGRWRPDFPKPLPFPPPPSSGEAD